MFVNVLLYFSLILFPSIVYSKNLSIVATIKPLQSIVQNVVGDLHKVELLVTKSSSPHFYSLKPSDVQKIHSADLVFLIDEQFEAFLNKFSKNKNYKNKIFSLSKTKSLTIYKNRDSEFWRYNTKKLRSNNQSDHDHHHILEEHNHEHSHGNEKNDYHIWLDVNNVKLMANQIFKLLINKDPDNQKIYTKNLEIFLSKLEKLDLEINEKLTSLQNIKFIVFHDAYQYLDRKYNLSPSGVVLINSMHRPTIKELSNLINKIKGEKIKCLFSEPQFSQDIATLITDSTGIKMAILDAEWGIDNEGIDLNEAYFYMMRKISSNINSCLQ